MLSYVKASKIWLADVGHNEKWLHDRIAEDTTILGLGDIRVLEHERSQSTGGRLDFLLFNSQINTKYEVEIQLGKTDESHIIRTIEYWDIEKRRNPNTEHKAVIIAEEITNRFFNVISLMNRSIPIIALQLNALKMGDKIILNFTKVLDTYESPEDEAILAGVLVDRPDWLNKSNQKSMELMDSLIKITEEVYEKPRIKYNKNHIALGTEKRNYAWFEPRKAPGYCYFSIRIDIDKTIEIKKLIEDNGIEYTMHGEEEFSFSLIASNFEEKKEVYKKILIRACELAK